MNKHHLETNIKGLNECYDILAELEPKKLVAPTVPIRKQIEQDITFYEGEAEKYKLKIQNILSGQITTWQTQEETISQEIVVLNQEFQKIDKKSSLYQDWKKQVVDFVKKYKFSFLFLGLGHIDSLAKVLNIPIPDDKWEMFKEILGEVKDMF